VGKVSTIYETLCELGLSPREADRLGLITAEEYVNVSEYLANNARPVPLTGRMMGVIEDARVGIEAEEWGWVALCARALFTLIAGSDEVPDALLMVSEAYFEKTCAAIGGDVGTEMALAR
jgi:hypothetical protein